MTFKGHTVKEEHWGDKHKCFAEKNVPLWAAYYIQQHTLYPTATAPALGAPWWYLRPERSRLETSRRVVATKRSHVHLFPGSDGKSQLCQSLPNIPVVLNILYCCRACIGWRSRGAVLGPFAVTRHVPTPCKKKKRHVHVCVCEWRGGVNGSNLHVFLKG